MKAIKVVLQHYHRGRRIDVIALLARSHTRRGQ
jgi:hypothetical protein